MSVTLILYYNTDSSQQLKSNTNTRTKKETSYKCDKLINNLLNKKFFIGTILCMLYQS